MQIEEDRHLRSQQDQEYEDSLREDQLVEVSRKEEADRVAKKEEARVASVKQRWELAVRVAQKVGFIMWRMGIMRMGIMGRMLVA